MSFGALLVLALGLAMDATAIAAARGAVADRLRARDAAAVAALFGGLHAVMPLLGWLAGSRAQAFVGRWDHWITFVLLGAIGAKMLWDARAARVELSERAPFRATLLVAIAFATSLDALAIGVTLPLLGVPLLGSVAVIGGVAAFASAAGLLAGHRFGGVIGQRFEALGGVVLIVVGTKILVEHLAAGR